MRALTALALYGDIQMDTGMRLLEGAIFYTKGQTCDEFWDVEADEKFEVCTHGPAYLNAFPGAYIHVAIVECLIIDTLNK